MNILSTQYTLKYRSFEIIISGCKGENGIHCAECHSPETWDFSIGENYLHQIDKILKKIYEGKEMIDWIWVYGGEPLDNNLSELIDFLKKIRSTKIPLMLFTRKELEDVPSDILEQCDYIKCGAYLKNLRTDSNIQYGVKLATSNQKIYKLKEKN